MAEKGFPNCSYFHSENTERRWNFFFGESVAPGNKFCKTCFVPFDAERKFGWWSIWHREDGLRRGVVQPSSFLPSWLDGTGCLQTNWPASQSVVSWWTKLQPRIRRVQSGETVRHRHKERVTISLAFPLLFIRLRGVTVVSNSRWRKWKWEGEYYCIDPFLLLVPDTLANHVLLMCLETDTFSGARDDWNGVGDLQMNRLVFMTEEQTVPEIFLLEWTIWGPFYGECENSSTSLPNLLVLFQHVRKYSFLSLLACVGEL